MEDYESDNGRMLFAGMYAGDIAEEFGTPVYVTDEKKLRENYRRIHGVFNKEMNTVVNYACKANSNLAILVFSKKRDLTSTPHPSEKSSHASKRDSRRTGFFTPEVNVSNEELKAVSDLDVMINIDSESGWKDC